MAAQLKSEELTRRLAILREYERGIYVMMSRHNAESLNWPQLEQLTTALRNVQHSIAYVERQLAQLK